jgi:tellurite resistance protein TerC
VAVLLALDLGVLHRKQHEIEVRESLVLSAFYIALGLAFGGWVWWIMGPTSAKEYVTGFVVEKSLAMDNVFVIAMIFSYFAIPRLYQHRVLFWGILSALVLRAAMIFAGVALLERFHWLIYVFGAFLVVTGIRLARHRNVEIHPERNQVLKLIQRFLPISTAYHEDKLMARESGRLVATPMLAALALIAAFDVVFAVDSIPAIFAVTRDTFIVYAANAFSLLGLAAFYFVLADMIERFRYLNLGLAGVLVFVGLKMTLADVYEIPVHLSLAFIIAALAAAVAFSIVRPVPPTRPPRAAASQQHPEARVSRERATRKPASTEGGT